MIIYLGACSRYSFNSTRIGSRFDINGNIIKLIDNDWHKTIGSYKLIDNEDGTYSSFEINNKGIEYPISKNKSFNQKDLNNEIKLGHLILLNK